jgi:hypothetical protein
MAHAGVQACAARPATAVSCQPSSAGIGR